MGFFCLYWRQPNRPVIKPNSVAISTNRHGRTSGRKAIQGRESIMDAKIRPIKFSRSYTRYAEGSVLAAMGNTQVLCTASVSEDVPSFLKGKGKGWVTAEYSMLPRSTAERTARDSVKGKIAGRTHEIQRLIGRS